MPLCHLPLGAADVFEKLVATKDAEDCRKLPRDTEEEMNLITSGEPDLNINGEIPEIVLLSILIDSPPPAQGAER